MGNRTRKGVEGPGGHTKDSSGVSVELLDHRQYCPGDDLRLLDWNASARHDHDVIKLLHEERSPGLDILIDGSASMALAGTDKAEATVFLTAALSTAAAASGWQCRVWYAAGLCEQLEHQGANALAWPEAPFTAPSNPLISLRSGPPRWLRSGARALISDLLWPGDPRDVLHLMMPSAKDVAVIQVVSHHDLDPPDSGTLRLIDVESNQTLELVSSPAIAASYRSAVSRHQEMWREAARRLQADLIPLEAERLTRSRSLDDLIRPGLLEPAP